MRSRLSINDETWGIAIILGRTEIKFLTWVLWLTQKHIQQCVCIYLFKRNSINNSINHLVYNVYGNNYTHLARLTPTNICLLQKILFTVERKTRDSIYSISFHHNNFHLISEKTLNLATYLYREKRERENDQNSYNKTNFIKFIQNQILWVCMYIRVYVWICVVVTVTAPTGVWIWNSFIQIIWSLNRWMNELNSMDSWMDGFEFQWYVRKEHKPQQNQKK